jgi:AbrB family looped-hinge helix DNA binding protein
MLKGGRVTLPKATREAMNWPPGTELYVWLEDDGVVISPKPQQAKPKAGDTSVASKTPDSAT